MLHQITPSDLKARLDAGEEWVLVDVRAPDERDYVRLPGDRWIPMQEFPMRIREVPRKVPVAIYCHHGVRSLRAAWFLAQRGWENVHNLQGGIEAWARDVDPEMRRY